MKFGVREICNVVFKAKAETKIGSKTFKKGQPVLYIDTAKTSTLEGSAETVYATGGPGNTNLIAWEGEKKLTFTVEDALLSPIGFAVLSGAGLFKGTENEKVHVHTTSVAFIGTGNKIDLSDELGANEEIDDTAPIFIGVMKDGSLTGDMLTFKETSAADSSSSNAPKNIIEFDESDDQPDVGSTVFVDFYITKSSAKVSELQIDAEKFGGFYYVEASTLFRRESDGKDLPAEITLPKVKVQSNFTFSMASTGDPSTFTFTMDAFPGYTYFNPTKKVLCVFQIVDESESNEADITSVMKHNSASDYDTDANQGGKQETTSDSDGE